MTGRSLRVLLLEDDPDDAALLVARLQAAGYDLTWKCIEDESSFLEALEEPWDVILSDYMLPDFDGRQALEQVLERGLDTPFILVTGALEMRGVECVSAGAFDYLLKSDLGRLPGAVERALDSRRLREERAEAVAALEASERRFRRLFESDLTGLYVTTPLGELLDCNRALVRILGFSSVEEALRIGVKSLYEAPEQRAAFLEALDRDKELPQYDHSLRTHDDRVIHVTENSVGIWDEHGNLVEIYGHLIDVTEKVDAQAERDQLGAALTQAAEGIVFTDTEGNITGVNPAWEAMTGYTQAEVIGKNPRVLKSGAHEGAFYEDLWATISAGGTWSGKMTNRRQTGECYFVDATISPVRRGDGSIYGYMAFQKDVTREVKLEERLHASQRLEAVGQLATGIAHDFNNLMTVVSLNAQLALMDGADDDPMRGPLQETLESVRLGRSLTRRLLAFGRIQPMEPRVVDFSEVVAESERILRRTLGEDVTLTLELDPKAGNVLVDPAHLQSVILNLALNSRDAMPGGGTLSITTRRVILDEGYAKTREDVEPGPHAMVAVTDTGYGMDKETMARIFEPFFTTKEIGRGTGLGLATTYGTVRQSGGHIWTYSEPGSGTTMKLYFPIVADPVELSIPKHVTSPNGVSRSVLVVEDDDAVRRGIVKMLNRLGHSVEAAPSPAEALRLLAADASFEVLMTDMIMPGMTGMAMVDQVLESRPEQRVLFMSGYSAERAGLLPRGATFLEKPFTMEELADKLKECFGEER